MQQLSFNLQTDAILLFIENELPLFIERWHRFQDKNGVYGNCFYWWASRFHDDYPTYINGKYSYDNYILQGNFREIWEAKKQEMQR